MTKANAVRRPRAEPTDFEDVLLDRIERAVSLSSSPAMRETLASTFLNRLEVRQGPEDPLYILPATRVVIFAEKTPPALAIQDALAADGMATLILSAGLYPPPYDDVTFDRFAQLCIIDAEHIAQHGDLFNFCTALRRKNPDVPVILMSETFIKNDLSCERSLLCDASLGKDITRDNLRSVISAAASNNLARRLSECLTAQTNDA
jgi:CheY-like chemotaxis protein